MRPGPGGEGDRPVRRAAALQLDLLTVGPRPDQEGVAGLELVDGVLEGSPGRLGVAVGMVVAGDRDVVGRRRHAIRGEQDRRGDDQATGDALIGSFVLESSGVATGAAGYLLADAEQYRASGPYLRG